LPLLKLQPSYYSLKIKDEISHPYKIEKTVVTILHIVVWPLLLWSNYNRSQDSIKLADTDISYTKHVSLLDRQQRDGVWSSTFQSG